MALRKKLEAVADSDKRRYMAQERKEVIRLWVSLNK